MLLGFLKHVRILTFVNRNYIFLLSSEMPKSELHRLPYDFNHVAERDVRRLNYFYKHEWACSLVSGFFFFPNGE